MADAVYRREDELYHPTEWAGSPWSTESQHGGPINALMARALDALADLAGSLIGRTELRQRRVDIDAPRELYVNTDTHLHWERMPMGSWLGIEKILLSDRNGIGNAAAWLHDERGRFGMAQQSLLARSA